MQFLKKRIVKIFAVIAIYILILYVFPYIINKIMLSNLPSSDTTGLFVFLFVQPAIIYGIITVVVYLEKKAPPRI